MGTKYRLYARGRDEWIEQIRCVDARSCARVFVEATGGRLPVDEVAADIMQDCAIEGVCRRGLSWLAVADTSIRSPRRKASS
jgi:hypothetical protein